MRTYYAIITQILPAAVFPTRPDLNRPAQIMMSLSDLRIVGKENEQIPVHSPEELHKLIEDHPEVTKVNFTGRWMPQRSVEIGKVDAKLIQKQFKYYRR